jgi:hypothetical protein
MLLGAANVADGSIASVWPSRILFDDPTRFLRARQLKQRIVLTLARFFGRFHTGKVGIPQTG